MNPQQVITELLAQKMRNIKSLLQSDQLRGSLGLSLGCGTRIMSRSLPVLCFKWEATSIRQLKWKYLTHTIGAVEIFVNQWRGAWDMIEMTVV